jgi:hypothetical protein
MPAKGTKKLTAQRFNTITAQLKANPHTPDMFSVIAAANGVKVSTVKSVARAKTFAEYERRKAALAVRADLRRRSGTTIQDAKKLLDKTVQEPANQIRASRPLPTDVKTVTVEEWNEVQRELGILHQRIDAMKTPRIEAPAKRTWFGKTK